MVIGVRCRGNIVANCLEQPIQDRTTLFLAVREVLRIHSTASSEGKRLPSIAETAEVVFSKMKTASLVHSASSISSFILEQKWVKSVGGGHAITLEGEEMLARFDRW